LVETLKALLGLIFQPRKAVSTSALLIAETVHAQTAVSVQQITLFHSPWLVS